MNSVISGLSIFLFVFALTVQTTASSSSSSTPEVLSSYEFAERNDLIELRDSLSSTLNLHARWTGPPCYKNRSRWIGITCSDFQVTGINLQGIQLTGSLRPTALQNVPYLQSLDLSDNALHGDIPTLAGLVYLQDVSLSGNKLSGQIPAEYAALASLTRLELQDNLLNGTIPAFSQQSLSVFNVSFNFLQGMIPETPVMQRFPVSSYDHNLGLCGRPLDKPCQAPAPSPAAPVVPVRPPPSRPLSPPTSSRPERLELWALILVAVGAVMVPVVVVSCVLCFCRRNRRNDAARKGEISGMLVLLIVL